MNILFGDNLRLRPSGRGWALERLGGKTWQKMATYDSLFSECIGRNVVETLAKLHEAEVPFANFLSGLEALAHYIDAGIDLDHLCEAVGSSIQAVERAKDQEAEARQDAAANRLREEEPASPPADNMEWL